MSAPAYDLEMDELSMALSYVTMALGKDAKAPEATGAIIQITKAATPVAAPAAKKEAPKKEAKVRTVISHFQCVVFALNVYFYRYLNTMQTYETSFGLSYLHYFSNIS